MLGGMQVYLIIAVSVSSCLLVNGCRDVDQHHTSPSCKLLWLGTTLPLPFFYPKFCVIIYQILIIIIKIDQT